MHRVRRHRLVPALLGTLVCLATIPGVAQAHGPIAPVASSYLAKVSHVPAGLEAKVVDGDLRMWLNVPAGLSVVVLDYRGAPYLRFSRLGVQVNQNSSMYYLNQAPVAGVPPSSLSRTTPPNWQPASGGHDYGWHDGRLGALASVAVSPGTRYVGQWKIPILIDGQLTAVSGPLWHADNPSIVWFWPIVVLLACVLAAWRLRRPALDARLARALGLISLIAVAAAGAARGLHGRPGVSISQVIELVVTVAFVAWGVRRVLFRPPGYSYFLIAFVALWEGFNLLPTLLHGFVLVAMPAFVARSLTVLCLGCGIGILLIVFRLADHPETIPATARRSATDEDDPEHLHEAYGIG
jgi:hypothetical protein